MKRVALAAVYAAFTVAGIAMSATARTSEDRFAGAAIAAFFGIGGVLYFGRDLLDRGVRMRPSPALHVGGGRTEPDRLALSASPLRLGYIVAGAGFFALCATIGFDLMGGIAGWFEGILSTGMTLAMLVVAGVLARGPLIVFERDALSWRPPLRAPRSIAYVELAGGTVSTSAAGLVCTLDVRDPGAYLASLPPRRAREALKNLTYYGAPIVLPNGVAPNAEQVLTLVAQYASFPVVDALGTTPPHRGTDDLELPTKPHA